ncbi:hypothetical protein SK128_015218, partial [Halocaridina rubra]
LCTMTTTMMKGPRPTLIWSKGYPCRTVFRDSSRRIWSVRPWRTSTSSITTR